MARNETDPNWNEWVEKEGSESEWKNLNTH